MAGHRRPEIRFSDAPRGQCRWCGESVLHPSGAKAGAVDRRRRWHPECVDAYNASDPSEARRRIRRRDRGRCNVCRVFTHALRRKMRKLGRGRAKAIRELGFKPGQSFWELDHIIPLVDGGSHEDENLQTLCTPCHSKKTAVEARQRAVLRRGDAGEPLLVEIESEKLDESPSLPRQKPRVETKPLPRMSLQQLLAAADLTNRRVQQVLDNWPSR